MRIYLRKITESDTKKQIETTIEAYKYFFKGDIDNDSGVEVNIDISGEIAKFKVSKANGHANSYRFSSAEEGEGLRKFINRALSRDLVKGDILRMKTSKKDNYQLDIVEKNSDDYDTLSKMIRSKDNTVIIVDNERREHSEIDCQSENIKDKNFQSMYFGAPGTGKSHDVSKFIAKIYPNIEERKNPFVFKTTIYSDYSYYDFIGNLLPTHNGEKLEYAFTPGIFTQALAMSLNYPEKEIFLVIEEMSRGNIASIFGDVFQLLDRKKDGSSAYSINNSLISDFLNKPIEDGGIEKYIEKIFLPRNLHIFGTVNTSDQNVNVIDTAFKRRFNFIYSDVEPVKDKEGNFLNSFTFKVGDNEFEWNKFYMSLNKLITDDLELAEDKQIGQFFIKFDNFINDEDKLDAIKNKLLHYLWEDVQSMAINDNYSIFDDRYKTFSKLYSSFGKKENIFSEKLLEIYKNLKLTD